MLFMLSERFFLAIETDRFHSSTRSGHNINIVSYVTSYYKHLVVVVVVVVAVVVVVNGKCPQSEMAREFCWHLYNYLN